MDSFSFFYGFFILLWDFLTQKFVFSRKRSPVVELQVNSGLEGKVAVVTGGNSGIGLETVRLLACAGAKVILTCRSRERGQQAVRSIGPVKPGSIEIRILDTSSLESVREFAQGLRSSLASLDVLVLNAGAMRLPYGPAHPGSFPEPHFATNHLGHFLLTLLLIPLLLKAPSARVVAVSSISFVLHDLDLDDLEFRKRPYNPETAYANSKMCNILFARELAKRLGTGSTICSSAVHPGDIVTEISKNMGKFLAFGHRYVVGPMLIKLEKGAWTQVYAAVHPDMEGVTGRLLWRVDETIPFEEKPLERLEPDCQSRLWDICLDLCSATDAEKAMLP